MTLGGTEEKRSTTRLIEFSSFSSLLILSWYLSYEPLFLFRREDRLDRIVVNGKIHFIKL